MLHGNSCISLFLFTFSRVLFVLLLFDVVYLSPDLFKLRPGHFEKYQMLKYCIFNRKGDISHFPVPARKCLSRMNVHSQFYGSRSTFVRYSPVIVIEYFIQVFTERHSSR